MWWAYEGHSGRLIGRSDPARARDPGNPQGVSPECRPGVSGQESDHRLRDGGGRCGRRARSARLIWPGRQRRGAALFEGQRYGGQRCGSGLMSPPPGRSRMPGFSPIWRPRPSRPAGMASLSGIFCSAPLGRVRDLCPGRRPVGGAYGHCAADGPDPPGRLHDPACPAPPLGVSIQPIHTW